MEKDYNPVIKEVFGNHKKIKSIPNGKEKKYSSSRKILNRILALGVAGGMIIGGSAIISGIVKNHKHENSLEESIRIASAGENMKSDEALQNLIEEDVAIQQEDIDSLLENVKTYKELRYKEDRSFDEEKKYIEVCEKIWNDKYSVISMYTDEIKAKIAKAYKIEDKEEMNKIEIRDSITYSNDGPEHFTTITLPDEKVLSNHEGNIDSKLEDEIKNARSLLDVELPKDDRTMEALEEKVDKIVEKVQKAIEFQENYKLKVNGDYISTEKVEKENGQER